MDRDVRLTDMLTAYLRRKNLICGLAQERIPRNPGHAASCGAGKLRWVRNNQENSNCASGRNLPGAPEPYSPRIKPTLRRVHFLR